MYELSNPAAPRLLGFFNAGADLGTEGLTFISAADSPSGQPLVILTNEVSGTVSILTVAAPSPTQAVSRKFHGAAGTFDIALPGIECRNAGPTGFNHQVVFTFPNEVTYSGATFTGSGGSVNGSPTSPNAIEVTVNLANVTDAQTGTVTLSNVDNGVTTGDVTVPISFLLGDTNGNRSVNASDIGQTKSQAGQPVGGSNFRTDVTVDGSVTASDVGLVKSRTGSALP
jgi:hypothetical protein